MQADLRSDTVTQPSPGMIEAMMSAPLGDDVFGEDPTVISLEQKVADIFGKEAGLFFPSGTMANQAGIKSLTSPADEIICDHTAHIYLYEGGGLAFNSGISAWLLPGDRGRITSEQVAEAIRPDNDYSPKTSIVALENTHNRGGGSIYSLQEIAAINNLCKTYKLKLHLDGARIFNALAEADYTAKDIGKLCDSISVCLSKGLGTPVGSVLLASKEVIAKARRVRKLMGGGMRQAGILAAAGIYALDNNVTGLKDDHRRAKILGSILAELPFVEAVVPVDTNIVITKLNNNYPLATFISRLMESGIKTVAFGKQSLRMVTHLDFNDDQLDNVCGILKKMN
ncbi:MAG: aminotransferase class I/II-fold pyridoxal phosphate-dependent enzyme [Bacteroidota bacterium]|nr:aminotransferase class I/II-fold pyridoxal phosphate-dependent enzyme [Bacteroidota bacterium]